MCNLCYSAISVQFPGVLSRFASLNWFFSASFSRLDYNSVAIESMVHTVSYSLPRQVYKALMKKLKLKATEMQALSNVLIEADLAYQLQEEHQLPVKLDEKLGAVHELLTLADSRTFDKTSVEDLLAFLKEIPPLDLAEVTFSFIQRFMQSFRVSSMLSEWHRCIVHHVGALL